MFEVNGSPLEQIAHLEEQLSPIVDEPVGPPQRPNGAWRAFARAGNVLAEFRIEVCRSLLYPIYRAVPGESDM